jgi:hypothetical protein
MTKYFIIVDDIKVDSYESPEPLLMRDIKEIEAAYNKHQGIIGARL